MGIAAYNRGSRLIRERADREATKTRPQLTETVRHDVNQETTEPPAPQPFAVGEKVYCIVHGAEKWTEVTETRGPSYDQYIKIKGFRSWCPAYNFNRTGERR